MGRKMKAIVNVNAEMIDVLDSWRDGGRYQLDVTQTAPFEFTLDDAREIESPEPATEPAQEGGASAGAEAVQRGRPPREEVRGGPALAILFRAARGTK